jgi:hypothetical protein
MINKITAKVFSWVIRISTPFFGTYCRGVVRIPLVGRMVGLTNKLTGRLLPRLSFLGFRPEASYGNAVRNWEIFLGLIGATYDVEEISPRERRYTIHKCPAGHCRIGHLEACKATMELDNSLVEASGARLIVDKRFPVDGVCVERVVADESQ